MGNQTAASAGIGSSADTPALVLPIVVDALLQVVIDIFVDIHVRTGAERRVTGHVLEVVGIRFRVVDDGLADSRRVVEEERVAGVRVQGVVVGLGQRRRVSVRWAQRVRQLHFRGECLSDKRPIGGVQAQMPEADHEKRYDDSVYILSYFQVSLFWLQQFQCLLN